MGAEAARLPVDRLNEFFIKNTLKYRIQGISGLETIEIRIDPLRLNKPFMSLNGAQLRDRGMIFAREAVISTGGSSRYGPANQVIGLEFRLRMDIGIDEKTIEFPLMVAYRKMFGIQLEPSEVVKSHLGEMPFEIHQEGNGRNASWKVLRHLASNPQNFTNMATRK